MSYFHFNLLNTEYWSSVPGFPGVEVSTKARVKILERVVTYERLGRTHSITIPEKIRPAILDDKGYLRVKIPTEKNRVQRFYPIHRLVAAAFVPGQRPGLTVNHINGNKRDNLPHNLEWITLSENIRHAHGTGLINQKGERSTSAKLKADQVREIRVRLANGEKQRVLAAEYGVGKTVIGYISQGKIWKSV